LTTLGRKKLGCAFFYWTQMISLDFLTTGRKHWKATKTEELQPSLISEARETS